MLGLNRLNVELSEYNPAWKQAFLEEEQALAEVLGKNVVGIEHIGSTAIPGISAKPILDLMVAVDSIKDYQKFHQVLEKIGYTFRRDFRDKQQHILYVKGPESNRTHYLKLTTKDSKFWNECLLFRNYLISNPDMAREYHQLKLKLQKEHNADRSAYTKGKSEFIAKVLQQASS